MFRSSQLFAGTSLTLFFKIFGASNIDSAVSILYKILFNANSFNPHKRPTICWIWPPAPSVCSEHGDQEQALKLSLNPIDIELSAMVSPSHRPCEVIHHWQVQSLVICNYNLVTSTWVCSKRILSSVGVYYPAPLALLFNKAGLIWYVFLMGRLPCLFRAL